MNIYFHLTFLFHFQHHHYVHLPLDIHPNATWIQNGITVAGGNGQGNGMNQLSDPLGLYVDDDETVYVADYV